MHRNLPLVDAGIMMRAVNKLEVSNIKPLCKKPYDLGLWIMGLWHVKMTWHQASQAAQPR